MFGIILISQMLLLYMLVLKNSKDFFPCSYGVYRSPCEGSRESLKFVETRGFRTCIPA